MPRFTLLALFVLTSSAIAADDPLRLFPEDKKPADRRLSTVRTLNDKDFFLRPPRHPRRLGRSPAVRPRADPRRHRPVADAAAHTP